jgi:hypothetical protein
MRCWTTTGARRSATTTVDNEHGIATGWNDGQLSERGRALAARLGERRRNHGVDAIFSSDLGRAVETVEVAFTGSDIPVHLDARLRECNYGEWNGMPVARLAAERRRRIREPFPGGESYLDVVDRVADFLADLARDWEGATCCSSATRPLVGPRSPARRSAARGPGRRAVRVARGVAVRAPQRLAATPSPAGVSAWLRGR